jgi:3-deoxy-7-phosphoheptulonate synthase
MLGEFTKSASGTGAVMHIENKFPGKDISADDLKSKFPLAAKSGSYLRSVIRVAGVTFGGPLIPVFAGPNTSRMRK